VTIDVRKFSNVTDFYVLATGAVDVHLKAVTDNIIDRLKEEGVEPLHIEGYDNLRWVLIDYIEVVAHLFLPQTRKFYSLEKLWGEAPITKYDE